MRRVLLIGVLLITLVACGTVATPSAAPTAAGPSPQAAAYPAPASATVLPSAPSPTLTSVPTVLPSLTADVKPLTITKIQSWPLSHQAFGAVDLIGWSPDDRYFLYDRVDRFDQASQLLLGELYAVDLATGTDIRIPRKDVILGIYSGGFTYNLSMAYWSEQCCAILTSAYEHGKQSIESIDLHTQQVRHLKTTDLALFGYQGAKVGVIEQSGFTVDDKPVSHQFLDATTWLTSTMFTRHGVYTHNGRDLRYISDTNEVWEMRGDTTFLKDKPQYEILQLASSPDDTMLVVIITRTDDQRELWLINRITNAYELILAADKISYPSWSQDGTFVMYRLYRTLTILDLTTQTQTRVIGDAKIPVWHHTKPWFAMFNQDATAIDIYAVSRSL